MDVREKLVELLRSAYGTSFNAPYLSEHELEPLASHLIANGVTVQELNGCDFCQKFDFAGARAEVNKYGAHISLGVCSTKFPNKEQFKFCPMCGRKLTQPPKGD